MLIYLLIYLFIYYKQRMCLNACAATSDSHFTLCTTARDILRLRRSAVDEMGQSVFIYVSNHTIVTDPTIRQPGFNLPRHTWLLTNRFLAGQGPCRANLHKWGLAQSPSCDCGQRQTMNQLSTRAH